MKRSELNHYLKKAVDFMEEMQFVLPPFAFFSPEKWVTCGTEYDEIRDATLGWDVTDFGGGDFLQKGLLLFTVRNGVHGNAQYSKPYAEKIMIVEEEQITPFHFHWSKQEDIINRGGGVLLMQVYNATAEEGLADTEVTVSKDGCRLTLPAGSIIRIEPGESVTVHQGLYHSFWAEKGKGKVLAGEVSMTNDDRTDNRFLEPAGRFPEVDEDEKPLYLLATEYPTAKKEQE